MKLLVTGGAGYIGSVVASQLRDAGHEVGLMGLDGIRGLVEDTAARITASMTGETGAPLEPHYVVVYAVDAAQALLEIKDDKRVSGVDRLRTVLKHGPEHRTHVLGWWRGVQRLKNSLPPGVYDDVGAWVAFDVQGKDLVSFGPEQVLTWSPRPRRGLFFDRFEHSRPQVVIPFDTEPRRGSALAGEEA